MPCSSQLPSLLSCLAVFFSTLLILSSMFTIAALSVFNNYHHTALAFKPTPAPNQQLPSTTSATKTTLPPNQPPLADAGTARTVNAGDIVKLDGSKSKDPDGDPITYSWTQIAGPSVTVEDCSVICLNGTNTATPSFTVPSLSSDTALKFSLTVKDDKGVASKPAIVSVIAFKASPTGMNKAAGVNAPPTTTGPGMNTTATKLATATKSVLDITRNTNATSFATDNIINASTNQTRPNR